MDVREKLVELLQDQNNPVWRWFPNNMAMMQLADYLIKSGVTVQHGRWIEEDGIQCSECGEEHEWEDYRAPYCDTCGAKMAEKAAKEVTL